MDFLSQFDMTHILNVLETIGVFVGVLGVLVFVHEWGHYAAAKSVGIKVKEFAVGFGPALYRWHDKSGTAWKIGSIPLGGYVHMKGQEDGKAMEVSNDPDSFTSKTVLQRSWVVFAGPLVNFVFALLLLMGVMMWGEERLLPEIGGLQENMPALEAGLQEGDVVRVVNDVAVEHWDHLRELTGQSAEKTLQMVVERQGELIPITVTPEFVTYTDLLGDEHTVGRIGASPSGERFVIRHGIVGGLWRGVEKTWEMISLTYISIYKLIIGSVSPENLAGPLGIADMAKQSSDQGWYTLFMFMAIISINLGIINLIPIPILDGGHLLFFAIEAVKGSPVGEKTQEWSLRFGLVAILALVLFSTSNDVRRFADRFSEAEPAVDATMDAPK